MECTIMKRANMSKGDFTKAINECNNGTYHLPQHNIRRKIFKNKFRMSINNTIPQNICFSNGSITATEFIEHVLLFFLAKFVSTIIAVQHNYLIY